MRVHAAAAVLVLRAGYKQSLERLPELAAHHAVDEEVQRIRQHDEEVDVHGRRLEAFGQHARVERVVYHVQNEDDRQRELDDQKNGDDDDQHERSAVTVLQAATLGLAVQQQQLAASRLRRAHHVDQDGVQHDQRRARDEVDEYDAEPVVHVEVRVQVLHHEVLVVDAARRHNVAVPRG